MPNPLGRRQASYEIREHGFCGLPRRRRMGPRGSAHRTPSGEGTAYPYRQGNGAGSLNEGLSPCLSRMRGQLARPVLRGAKVSNGLRLLDSSTVSYTHLTLPTNREV